VAVVEHGCCAVESKPVEVENLNPPSKIWQQKPQNFPPARRAPQPMYKTKTSINCSDTGSAYDR